MTNLAGKVLVLAAMIAAGPAATTIAADGPSASCSSVLVAAHSCVADVSYPRSTPSTPAQYDRLFGMFSSLSYYTNNPGFGLSDSWERARIQAVGGNAQRWLISWRSVQPDGTQAPFLDLPLGTVSDNGPETHTIAVSDHRYLTLLAAGMVPVIGVYGVPRWARAVNAPGSEEVPDPQYWDAFIRALALRYPGAVLEGFNEPNLVAPGDPGRSVPAARMAAMQADMYREVKAVNPGQPVLGPSVTNAGNPGAWGLSRYANELYADGMKGKIDGFSLHPYPGSSVRTAADLRNPANRFTTAFREVRDAMARAGDAVPLYATELGVTTSGLSGVTPTAQRDIILAMHRSIQAMPDVRGEIYFALRDRAGPEMRFYQFDYGLGWLRTNGTPKPVYCAFVAAAGSSYPGC